MIAERRSSPLASGVKRRGSSPPSPVFDFPPIRFMAIARVSWDSGEIEPSDIAPVEKRRTMSLAGSTSSSGTGSASSRSRSSPRSSARREVSPLVGLGPLAIGLLRDLAVRVHRVLEPRDRVGVPDVVLAVAAPLEHAADRKHLAIGARVGPEVALEGLAREDVHARRRRSATPCPVKWRSTSPGSSPTASKICAPQ